jgi:hypothetical protein
MDKRTPRILILIDIAGAFLTCLITLALFATNMVPTGMPLFVLRFERWCIAFRRFFLWGKPAEAGTPAR